MPFCGAFMAHSSGSTANANLPPLRSPVNRRPPEVGGRARAIGAQQCLAARVAAAGDPGVPSRRYQSLVRGIAIGRGNGPGTPTNAQPHMSPRPRDGVRADSTASAKGEIPGELRGPTESFGSLRPA